MYGCCLSISENQEEKQLALKYAKYPRIISILSIHVYSRGKVGEDEQLPSMQDEDIECFRNAKAERGSAV